MIYTSYYSKKDGIDTERNRYCSISVGTPRWKLPYELAHCRALKPYGVFGVYQDGPEYEKAYRAKLDKIGVEEIRRQIKEAQGDKENIILLCYEKNKKECHRYIFAQWWEEKTGEKVEEI